MANKKCPICDWNKDMRGWKRHMVHVHGWRYYDGKNPEPPKPEGDGHGE